MFGSFRFLVEDSVSESSPGSFSLLELLYVIDVLKEFYECWEKSILEEVTTDLRPIKLSCSFVRLSSS
jgi:hypothetical protein